MLIRSTLVLLAFAGSAAFAEPPAQTPPPPDGLGGPKVHETGVPGTQGAGFGGDFSGARKDRPRELPQPMWMNALREALGPGAPENVRATPEQYQKIVDLNDEFMKSVRSYMQEHRDEIRALRDKYADKRGKGGADAPPPPPPGGPEDMRPPEPPADPALREKFMTDAKSLRENAPQPGDLRKKIWAVLSPEQQKAVEIKVAQAEHQLDERMIDQKLPAEAKRLREKLQDRAAGNTAPQNSDRARGTKIAPEQMERIVALLERLTPEQREQLIQRLEARAKEAGDQGQGPGASGQNPPPPPPPEGNGGQNPRRRRARPQGEPPAPPPPPPGGN